MTKLQGGGRGWGSGAIKILLGFPLRLAQFPWVFLVNTTMTSASRYGCNAGLVSQILGCQLKVEEGDGTQ